MRKNVFSLSLLPQKLASSRFLEAIDTAVVISCQLVIVCLDVRRCCPGSRPGFASIRGNPPPPLFPRLWFSRGGPGALSFDLKRVRVCYRVCK